MRGTEDVGGVDGGTGLAIGAALRTETGGGPDGGRSNVSVWAGAEEDTDCTESEGIDADIGLLPSGRAAVGDVGGLGDTKELAPVEV